MTTYIKFCGITRAEDAQDAMRLGAQAVGLVFARSSPRFISPERAAMIRGLLPPTVHAVALFRNPEASLVHEVLDAVRPDLLQFHGEESRTFCEGFGRAYWRAVPMGEPQDLQRWARGFPQAAALLLDGHAPGAAGGQGRAFDWSTVTGTDKPLVLAGGLTPDNVRAAVRQVRPYAVDVSSGVESAPGIKDPEKMRRFVAAVRQADAI